MSMSIEQLIDIVRADLTMSGLFPDIIPPREIKRIIKEHALEFFYKNYRFSLIKTYYWLGRDCMQTDTFSKYKSIRLPDEVEAVTRIIRIDDPSLFRLGIQAPHLSINLGVTNQPFLTSFVTTVGDLAVYRSIISAFSDEINKMNRNYVKFQFNHVDKRLHILTDMLTDLMLEVDVRLEQDEIFDWQLFKDYVIGLSRMRQGEAVGRVNLTMPGNFQYNASDMIQSGRELVEKVETKIKETTNVDWFFMGL